jgi:hypothetical protein
LIRQTEASSGVTVGISVAVAVTVASVVEVESEVVRSLWRRVLKSRRVGCE